jgi:nucleotide-binding universal stress UspA family protein
MHGPNSSFQSVVVGIDGSRSAAKAVLWAVDEAVDRDIPLRLVYAIDASEPDPGVPGADLGFAENAVRDAVVAIEAAHKPVKIEAEIVPDRPIAALLVESRSAAMVCVGSTGLKHAVHGRIGSTASTLAATAHCPVAVVPLSTLSIPAGCVLAVLGESPSSSSVLELAVAEARLRGAPLRVLAEWRQQASGMHVLDKAAASARLERYLATWRRNHPSVDIQSVNRQGSVVNYLEYLARNAEPVQLVIVDPRRAGPIDILLGPAGRAALDTARASLLVCHRQRWL